MFLNAIASLLLSVQPICTPKQFREFVNTNFNDSHYEVAQAIFDVYTDALQNNKIEPLPARATPRQSVEHKKKTASNALQSFEEMIGSLQLIDNSMAWNLKLVNVRREVLLESRPRQNPWPSAVWANIPWTYAKSQRELVFTLDQFFIENFKLDLQDRFDAELAILQHDNELCKSIESRSMKRWCVYDSLVGHIQDSVFKKAMFPQLKDVDEGVISLNNWIVNNTDDATVINSARHLFFSWLDFQDEKQEIIKSIVRTARLQYGIDPWSNGCGTPTQQEEKVKNQMLKTTAEMQEHTTETMKLMLDLLTEEQAESFQSQ